MQGSATQPVMLNQIYEAIIRIKVRLLQMFLSRLVWRWPENLNMSLAVWGGWVPL